ncbi:MAG: hypothetical protein IJ725_01150 [Ruminococcus sp.]|nr:hypothetical protein [Ruminococcus sp.]
MKRKAINYKGIIIAFIILVICSLVFSAEYSATTKSERPYLTVKGKQVSTITVSRNKYVAVRINGKVENESHKNTKYAKVVSKTGANVLNIKGLKVTPKNNPTTIKVKVNGITLNLNVKVIAKTVYQKSVNLVYKHTKPKISRNYLNTIHINGLYKVRTNLDKLYKQGKITAAQVNSLKKAAEKATYSVSNKSVLSLNRKNATVKCVGTGTSYVTIKFKDGTVYTTKITVTKPAEKTITLPDSHKKVKSRVCYDYEEIYTALKSEFYNHIIKGDYPEYDYLTCAFGKTNQKKLDTQLRKKAIRDYADGTNFYRYLTSSAGWYELNMVYELFDDRTTIYVGRNIDPINEQQYLKEHLALYKKTYIAAQKILKEIHIDDFKEDYQKLTVLTTYFKRNYSYGVVEHENDECGVTEAFNYYFFTAKSGICSEYAVATNYLCTLLNIPCYEIASDTHTWNVVKIRGKWYHLDILWYELFRGTEYINTIGSHIAKSLYAPFEIKNISNIDFDNNINAIFIEIMYDGNLTYTTDFFDNKFGW